jgi:hypothetical protein
MTSGFSDSAVVFFEVGNYNNFVFIYDFSELAACFSRWTDEVPMATEVNQMKPPVESMKTWPGSGYTPQILKA